MSNEASSDTIEPQLQDPPLDIRPEGIPDVLWNQILDAGRRASEVHATETPTQVSESPAHAPASLRLLSAAADSVTNRGAVQHTLDLADDVLAHTSAFAQVVASRTRAMEQGSRRALDEMTADGQEAGAAADQTSNQARQARAIIDEAMLTADLARMTMPARRPVSVDHQLNEMGDDYSTRYRRESTLSYLDRQAEFRERSRAVAALREAAAANAPNVNTTNGPVTTNLAINTASEPAAIIERSASARRDLERALRDYRNARRALRTHYTNEPASPGDQNTPSYQGVMAQIAEQQSNNRNRMRARGQSRSTTLDRTDAIVDRIAVAAGVGDAWREDDDDVETFLASANSNQNGEAGAHANHELRSALPAGVAATSAPYLGPTTSNRSSGGLSGGMREFYRRLDDRERSTVRPLATNTAGQDASTPAAAQNTWRRIEAVRGQRPSNAVERLGDTLTQLQARTGKPSYNTAKSKAKKILKYLSELKKLDNNTEKSLVLAKEIGFDNLADNLPKGAEIDLPTRIDELPKAQFSSFFDTGMSWEGVQRGGFNRPDTAPSSSLGGLATGPLFESGTSLEDRIFQSRTWRHRERARAGRPEEAQAQAQNDLAQSQDQARALLRGYTGRADILANAESHLSDVLEVEVRRATRGDNDDWAPSNGTAQTAPVPAPTATVTAAAAVTPAATAPVQNDREEKWPVKVNIHEVDWEKMTLTGTMVASQLPRQPSGVTLQSATATTVTAANAAADGSRETSEPRQMETFFDGEIVDFHTFELETVADKPGYKAGGLVTDLKYWSRVGPFKAIVEGKLKKANEKKAVEIYAKLGITGTLDEQKAKYKTAFNEQEGAVVELDKDEVGTIVYSTMAECIGSRKWIEKAMGEGGWILMRWKERCFTHMAATESSTASSAATTSSAGDYSRFRSVNRASTAVHTYTTNYADEAHPDRTSWGLTIQGFYYVALHRMTGKIEALYYDNGSQPYQELVCHPVGVRSGNMGTVGNKNESEEATTSGEAATADDDWDLDLGKLGISIRQDFGVYEFR